MRGLLMAAVVAALLGAAARAADVDPAKLVGMWEVTQGTQPPAGSTLELTRDGKFAATVKGQPISFAGAYRVSGDQLTLDPPGKAMTVVALTKDAMTIEGPASTMEYRRMSAAAAAKARKDRPRAGAMPGPADAAAAAALVREAFRAAGADLDPAASPKGRNRGRGAGPSGLVPVALMDGKVAVRMPHKPNGEGSGGGEGPWGEYDEEEAECGTDGARYLVRVVRYKGEIPEADLLKVFEWARNRTAGSFGNNPKLILEKAVHHEGVLGAEFAMTTELPPYGVLELRGRAFLRGKTLAVVAVGTTSRDKPLPPDTDRYLDSLSFDPPPGAAGSKVPAGSMPAPAAAAAGRAIEGWGTLVDAVGDVRARPKGRSLALEVPGTPHLLAPEREIMNAPRTAQPASGSFLMTVRVSGPFAPVRGSTVPGLSSRQAGGLVVWKDSKNYLVFQHRASPGDGGQVTHQAVVEELVDGRKGVTLRQPAPGGPLALRLERKDGRLLPSFSGDGRTWRELKVVETTWAAGAVEVGVVAVNTSTTPHPVTFDDFALKTR